MPRTVALIFGFTEGAWHGKRFKRALLEAGYTISDQPAEADIIIAHSGGCYYVPELEKHQLLMLIDPPYWPTKPIAVRSRNMLLHMIASVRPGNQPFFQVHKTAQNFWYLLRHHRTNRQMIKYARTWNLADEITHSKTILVHNEHDPWLTPELEHLKRLNRKLIIEHLPGGHDDCWGNPVPYVNLLQSAYEPK